MKPTSSEIQPNNTLHDNINICTPREIDILCGQDKACLNHEGSRCFRMIIDLYRQAYEKCSTKLEKMEITKEIFENIQNLGSRFLRYNRKAKSWQEINQVAARDKIGHALRFANQQQQRRQLQSNTQIKTQIKTKNSKKVSASFPYEELSLDKMPTICGTETETNFQALAVSSPSPSPSPSFLLPSLEIDKLKQEGIQQNSEISHHQCGPMPLSLEEYNEWKEFLEPDPLPPNSINHEIERSQQHHVGKRLPDDMKRNVKIQQDKMLGGPISYPALSIEEHAHSQQHRSDCFSHGIDERSESSLRGLLRHSRSASDPLPMSTLDYAQWQQETIMPPSLSTKLEQASVADMLENGLGLDSESMRRSSACSANVRKDRYCCQHSHLISEPKPSNNAS